MLLYTKIAPPKEPKKRSRAGCAYCKEKKKKCDEGRPKCSRCVEHAVDCIYEAIKPRQRRKRDSRTGIPLGSDFECVTPTTETSQQWHVTRPAHHYDLIDASSFETLVFDADPILTTPSTESFPRDRPREHDETTSQEHESENVGLVRRRSAYPRVLALATKSLSPDLAMIAPSPVLSPTLDFSPPVFSEFSSRANRRHLVDHFCNVLSHKIVFREESGNPFQQLVLPLSLKSSPVMNAIYALASAHLEYRGVQNVEKSSYFHNQAIQGLARVIENQGKVNKNEVLAAIMLLVYYEVLVQRGRSNIIDGHLKGAFTILSIDQDLTPASVFLERAFGFYDVIAALSLGTPPLSAAPSAGGLMPVPPLDAPPASPLTNIDTLLGMATTLWPIMHRLSNLLSMKKELEGAQYKNQMSKVAVLRAEFDATSQAIESALTQWKPYLPPNITIKDEVLTFGGGQGEEMPEMPQLQSILHNALAYRHSAFVYLYRTIYEYAPSNPLVQKHSHAALHHCVETTMAKGPTSALLWPLFVAACEATNSDDRDLAKKAFNEIEERQGMTNIGEAWRVIQEVWRRLDLDALRRATREMTEREEGEEEDDDFRAHSHMGGSTYGRTCSSPDLWRKVCSEMDVMIVFG